MQKCRGADDLAADKRRRAQICDLLRRSAAEYLILPHFRASALLNESGLTLIEMMIALLLMLILIAPLFSFMRLGQSTRSTSLRLVDIEQNARAAMTSIGTDIQNAGYNLAPRIPLDNASLLRPLNGTLGNYLFPILPGNNLNLVASVNSTGATVSNKTDQITLVFVDEQFNNGLPLSGVINDVGDKYTSDADFTGLYIGDWVVLGSSQSFALGNVTNITGSSLREIRFKQTDDPYGVDQENDGPIDRLDNPNTGANISLYKINFVSYFADDTGNLIRREQLPSPHTTLGGASTMTPASLTMNAGTFNCAGSCYYDNIIATNIEDLQFSYYLADPSGTGLTGPLDDPGVYGSPANCGAAPSSLCGEPNYRLLDIRRVKVSIKARASERDTKIRDPYNSKQGYYYRFTLEGAFSTRNFYGADYRPL